MYQEGFGGWQKDVVRSVNPHSPDRTFLDSSTVVQTVLEGVTRGWTRVLPCGQTRGGTRGG